MGQDFKDVRRDDITAEDGGPARRFFDGRLFDDAVDLEDALAFDRRPLDDAVRRYFFQGDFLAAQDGRVEVVVQIDHLAQGRIGFVVDDVVAEKDSEGFVSNEGLGAKDSIA